MSAEIELFKGDKDLAIFPASIDEIKQHPTEKPLKLFEYLIESSSNAGDVVLDPCLGSGTTAVACKKLNRNYIGIEISEEYCKIAEERLANT